MYACCRRREYPSVAQQQEGEGLLLSWAISSTLGLEASWLAEESMHVNRNQEGLVATISRSTNP